MSVLQNNKQAERYLAVFAHPDDDGYTAYNTLSSSPENAHLAFVTRGENGVLRRFVDGELTEEKIDPDTLGKIRQREGEESAQNYGISYDRLVFFDGFSDGNLENQEDELYQRLIWQIGHWSIDKLIVIQELDKHPDHRAVLNAACRAVGTLQAHGEEVSLLGLSADILAENAAGVCENDKREHLLTFESQVPAPEAIDVIAQREYDRGHPAYWGYLTVESLTEIDPLKENQASELTLAAG